MIAIVQWCIGVLFYCLTQLKQKQTKTTKQNQQTKTIQNKNKTKQKKSGYDCVKAANIYTLDYILFWETEHIVDQTQVT